METTLTSNSKDILLCLRSEKVSDSFEKSKKRSHKRPIIAHITLVNAYLFPSGIKLKEIEN